MLPATIAADLCFKPLYKHHRDEVFAHREAAIFDITVHFFTLAFSNIADVYEDFFCLRLIVEKVIKRNLNLHISGAFVAQRYIDNVLFANSSLMEFRRCLAAFWDSFLVGTNMLVILLASLAAATFLGIYAPVGVSFDVVLKFLLLRLVNKEVVNPSGSQA